MDFVITPDAEQVYADLVAEGKLDPNVMTLEQFGSFADAGMRRMLAKPRGPSERALKLAKQIGPDMLEDCRKYKMSMSDYLNACDPNDDPRDRALGNDAFDRVFGTLRAENGAPLRRSTNPAAGTRSSQMSDLWSAGPKLWDISGGGEYRLGRFLIWELARRSYERVFSGGDLFYASSAGLSPLMNPQFLLDALTDVPFQRSSILEQLIAVTTTVPAGSFKMPFLKEEDEDYNHYRVVEGAEIPTLVLAFQERSNNVLKHGFRLVVTYEVARQTPIDLFEFHVSRIALDRRLVSENEAVGVLVAGDGNSGTEATEYNVTDFGGTAGTVDPTSLFNVLAIAEEEGLDLSLAIAQRPTGVKLLTATYGSAEHPLFVGASPIATGGQLAENLVVPPLHFRDGAPSGKVVFPDTSQALGLAIEEGSEIQETDRDITHQIEIATYTRTDSFYIARRNATLVYDVDES